MRGKKNFDSMDSFTKEKNGGKWLSLDCRKGSGEKIEKRKRKGGDKDTKKPSQLSAPFTFLSEEFVPQLD